MAGGLFWARRMAWIGCPPGVPFHRLLESYFLWILAEKSAVIGSPGGGDLATLQEPTLTVLLVLPRKPLNMPMFDQDHGKGGVEFKGGNLHDGFGGFDGFGGSGEHLALLLLVLQNAGQ